MSPQSVFTEPTGLVNEYLATWRFGVTILFAQFKEPIFILQSAFETELEEFKMAQSTTTVPYSFLGQNIIMVGSMETLPSHEIVLI